MLEMNNKKDYYSIMEIRVLRYFLATAQEGSITKAAHYLHLTQPTLSRQLQDLEKELGQKLLMRGQHNVSLTSEGHILRQRAQEIIDMVDKTKSEFQLAKNTIAGTIFIGGGESRLIKLLTDIIKDIQDEYSEVKVEVLSGNAEDVTEKLDKGLLDFGVLIEPVDISKYDFLSLPEKDVWGLVMRKDSNLASLDEIKLEDLKNIPLISSKQIMKKNSHNRKFLEWFKGEFENLNFVAKYNLIYNAGLMVESGIGYALGLDGLINTGPGSDLTFRPLSPRLESGLKIVWKKSQFFSPAAKLFLEKMKENFDEEKTIFHA